MSSVDGDSGELISSYEPDAGMCASLFVSISFNGLLLRSWVRLAGVVTDPDEVA